MLFKPHKCFTVKTAGSFVALMVLIDLIPTMTALSTRIGFFLDRIYALTMPLRVGQQVLPVTSTAQTLVIAL